MCTMSSMLEGSTVDSTTGNQIILMLNNSGIQNFMVVDSVVWPDLFLARPLLLAK